MKFLKELNKLILNPKQRLNLLYNTFASEATFQTKPYRLHNLDQGPASETTVTKDEAITYFKQMTTIRKMEAKIANLYKEKKVRGFCHLYSGQEAVAVGLHSAFRPLDSAITSYRCHAWVYLLERKKDPLLTVFTELLGTSLGASRGKGGSMHMYTLNFFGGNGIVGAQVPLGVGIALAHKYQKKDAICVALFGDGASNQGQAAEAFNMAMLWEIPCIFVCENNLYSMGTSIARSTVNPNFYTRGQAMPGIWVDGNDLFSMKEVGKFARNHCISGKGPIMIEASTYRYFGHSVSDPGTSYRTREEVTQMRNTRDPINLFKNQIVSAGLCTEEELKKIDNEIKTGIDKTLAEAQKDKEIPVDELWSDVYANAVTLDIKLPNPWKFGTHKTSGRSPNLK